MLYDIVSAVETLIKQLLYIIQDMVHFGSVGKVTLEM